MARFEDQALTARFGTPLAADDRKANPFHTSHVIQMLLSAGIDNLNGIRHLIWGRPPESSDRPVLHQATHFVLARAAIEDFATALWILGPSSRPVRVERTLRWHVQNIQDRSRAIEVLGVTQHSGEDRLKRLEEIAERSLGAVPPKFRGRGFTATEVVKYADATNPEGGNQELSTEFLWRLCSGFTHGRFWSSLLFLEQEHLATDDPDVISVRMTSDLTRALWPTKEAMHLLERLLKLHNQRNTPHFP
ncbi:hypothetical protein FB381_4317 [Nocardioides albertanoniae]|uniref:Uncharacterized protein n=1 Tax=Nocardioides albertanoniae TaxID=1175486 RepID=A0A543ACT5_9ACTN|nr:hypothetical protein FB381_4317 [Nocardioides albertanoniae]